MFSLAEWIDKIRDKIFGSGFLFDGFFFVFDDYSVIGNLDNFFARDGEFWIKKRFDEWTFDDKLLDCEVVIGNSKIGNFAELGAFFGFNFEVDETKVEINDFADFYYVIFGDEFVNGIYHHAVFGIFANGFNVEDVGITFDKWSSKIESDNFKGIRVDNGGGNGANRAGGMHAENLGADEMRIVN